LKKSNLQNRNVEKTRNFQLKQARKQATRKSSKENATPQQNKSKFAGKRQGWQHCVRNQNGVGPTPSAVLTWWFLCKKTQQRSKCFGSCGYHSECRPGAVKLVLPCCTFPLLRKQLSVETIPLCCGCIGIRESILRERGGKKLP